MSSKHRCRRFYTSGVTFVLVFSSLLLASYAVNEVQASTRVAKFNEIESIGAGEGSALTQANADSVLSTVLDVITGRIYNDLFFTLHGFTEANIPTSTDYVLQTERDSYELKKYDCPKGGSADITLRMEDNGKFNNAHYVLLDCDWEDVLFNGESTEFNTNFGEFRNHFDQLSFVDADGQQSALSGLFSRTKINDYGSASPLGLYIFRSNDVVLSSNNIAGMLNIDLTQSSLSGGLFCPRFVTCYESASFSATFTLHSTQLANGHELLITTPQLFINDNGADFRFDRGTLRVVADDGSSMTVEANNGDPSTLTVTTVTSANISTTYNRPWTELRAYGEYVR